MIRVDADQKRLIDDAAIAAEETTANFARSALLKLVRGWRLVPPD
jgi:uncharacterized protein (DUF1778 family)